MKKKTKNLIKDLRETIEDLNEIADKYYESVTYAEVNLLKKALSNADQRTKVLTDQISNIKQIKDHSDELEKIVTYTRKDNKNMLGQINKQCEIIADLTKNIDLLEKTIEYQHNYIGKMTWWKLLIRRK